MTRKFWRWTRNETPDSFGSDRTLYLDGEISDETWYGDEITPQVFKDELNSGEGNITLWINSSRRRRLCGGADLQHADGLPV
jgi:ATP-dependent Clp protease protease subunit